MIERRKTRRIHIGDIPIGDGAPITVQTMTKTDTRDVKTTLEQIQRVARTGCDIIRCAVPDEKAALALKDICAESPLPVVADIHFSHKLALTALDAGIKGLRLNPGNIQKPEFVKKIAQKAGEAGIPIRVGVNAGSLTDAWREKVHKGECTIEEAMVESAMGQIRILEECGFNQMKVALKASDVLTTIKAYRLMASQCDYPFHVGITEAGTPGTGIIKSSIGIGALLLEGLVDTLRVSLTADPEEEVLVGIKMLRILGLRTPGPEVISCPTCGRVEIDIRSIADKLERHLSGETSPIKVAVMGCVVNGPGEAREADVGIAGGKGTGVLFSKGEIIGTYPEGELFDALIREIDRIQGKISNEK